MLKLTNSELRSVAKGRIVGYRGVFRKELEDLLSKEFIKCKPAHVTNVVKFENTPQDYK